MEYTIVDTLTGGSYAPLDAAKALKLAIQNMHRTWKLAPMAGRGMGGMWQLYVYDGPDRRFKCRLVTVTSGADYNTALSEAARKLLDPLQDGDGERVLEWLDADGRYVCRRQVAEGEVEPVEPDPVEVKYAGPWVVTVALADRAYGGPEEGGWYYDTWNPFDPDAEAVALENKAQRIFFSERAAEKYLDELQTQCLKWNKAEKRGSTSDVGSRGIYEAVLYEGWPYMEPKEIPTYS